MWEEEGYFGDSQPCYNGDEEDMGRALSLPILGAVGIVWLQCSFSRKIKNTCMRIAGMYRKKEEKIR